MIVIECKASAAPTVSSGFYRALEDLGLQEGVVVAPIPDCATYCLNDQVQVMTPLGFLTWLQKDS